jgi:hypothetical protein
MSLILTSSLYISFGINNGIKNGFIYKINPHNPVPIFDEYKYVLSVHERHECARYQTRARERERERGSERERKRDRDR